MSSHTKYPSGCIYTKLFYGWYCNFLTHLFRPTMGCRNGKPVLNEEDKKLLSETSGLTVDQVEERFQAFLKDHPDGKMKKKDFRCMISQVRCSKSLYLYLVICEIKYSVHK